MKRVLIIFFSILLLFSCKTNYHTIYDNNENVFGVSQVNQFKKNFSYEQFDSICIADKISNNLEKKWHKVKLHNSDLGDITQYLYIKTITNGQVIYRVQNTIYPDSLKITKRIER